MNNDARYLTNALIRTALAKRMTNTEWAAFQTEIRNARLRVIRRSR
jgi:hypothetical protein